MDAEVRSGGVRRRDLLSDVSYAIDLDLTSNRSRAVVRFECAAPGSSSHIDLAVHAVEAVSLNGLSLPLSAWRDGRLELDGLESSNVIEVNARVSSSDEGTGLVSFVDDGGERFVYTRGRTEGVTRWAPCFLDVPGTWDLRLVLPDGWTALSHSPPASPPAEGLWRFLPPYPLAYGPNFAAGPWSRVEGPDEVVLWSRPSVADQLVHSSVGEHVASAIAIHEAVLGVAYPFQCRDCVFIPDYGSQAGNSGGFILFHERVLQASLSEERTPYVKWVTAHETAHSWFGDLVGFAGEEHRWTAEGIATYLCHRANGSWPRFHVLEEMEAHGDDQDASEAPSLIYAKPAALVRHLESLIGVEAVEAGLTAWLRRHAGGSATGEDLIAEWSESAGMNLWDWAQEWLLIPGLNTLAFDRAEGVIRQTGTPLRTHHLTVQAFDEALTPLEPVDLVVSESTTEIRYDAVRDAALVVLNSPARTYAKVRLDPRSRTGRASCLGSLDEATRAACWVAGVEMVADGLMPASELRGWIDAFVSVESDPQVRELLVRQAAGATG